MTNTYRVIIKKNLGLGKRMRINIDASSITDLTTKIEVLSKAERFKPMRASLLIDNKPTRNYKIKISMIGECTITDKADIKTAKKKPATSEEISARITAKAPASSKPIYVTARAAAMADMENDGFITDTDEVN